MKFLFRFPNIFTDTWIFEERDNSLTNDNDSRDYTYNDTNKCYIHNLHLENKLLLGFLLAAQYRRCVEVFRCLVSELRS